MMPYSPAVFAVGNAYQIIVPVLKPSLFWVEIGDYVFEDETNGILRSEGPTHRVTIPMHLLDEAKTYTVCLRPIIERKPYFTQTEDVIRKTYTFSPITSFPIRAYHISDAHERINEPIAAANAFGDIDLVILNGDIFYHAGDREKFLQLYNILDNITHGSIPVVYSRGNHDTRGKYAEELEYYTPNHQCNTYYSFRLGPLWGVVLDCGEDKDDTHAEYGHTMSCRNFRARQTVYLQQLISDAVNEYQANGIQTRLVVCHIPFMNIYENDFNIEADTYHTWCSLLGEHIKPHAFLCGHLHDTYVQTVPNEQTRDLPCPLIVGSKPLDNGFKGCGLIFDHDRITVRFTDSDGDESTPIVIQQ